MDRFNQSYLRAQLQYDAQEPPEDDPRIECSDCSELFIPEHNSAGEIKHYKCPVCRELEDENKTNIRE